MKSIKEGAPVSEPPWPSRTYAWYVVIVLLLAQICSFIDRQIISLFLDPIREDLQLSDTQVGVLGGFAFAMFYAVMGIPIARLADQSNRKRLIAAGVTFWSIMTALTGTAQGFWQLFLARMGVGAGEAALSPSAFSILSDYFPRDRLARAISVYSLGAYFGMGIAMLAGGLFAQLAEAQRELPLIGPVEGWQMAFFYAALLGVPMVLLLLTVREPARREAPIRPGSSLPNPSSLPALLGFLRSNRRAVAGLLIGFPAYFMANAAFLLWAPTFFIRTYGLPASTVGWMYGLILLVFGSSGVFASGYLADRLARGGNYDAPIRVALYGAFAAIPFVILTPLMPNATLAMIGMCGVVFFVGGPPTLGFAAFPMMTPNRLRAQVTAIFFLANNLLVGLSPVIVALVTDYGFGDPKALRYSLVIAPVGFIAIGAGLLYLSMGPYRQAVARLLEAPAAGQGGTGG